VNSRTPLFQVLHAVVGLAALTACSQDSQAQLDTRDGNGRESVATREPSAAGALPDFRPLVREYGDAVVNVEVQQTLKQTRSGPSGLAPNDPLLEFFRRFGIPAPELGPGDEPPLLRGAGSGFIIGEDGYILTNAHVVAEADEVTVTLTDRREYPAKVIGIDPRTDIAVIKIDAENLPTVKIGNAKDVEPGQWVLAIGSPFGLENTATAGIVSATSRSVGGEIYVPFIQTDVAVNPGNSGGPLFNLDGEVIGINSMIFSRTGGYMGVSFAIPIDVAMNVRDQLVKTGHVVRGRIGVAVQDVDAPLSQSFGLDRPRGALVSSVDPDGPAAEAGVRPGDVILGVNDKPIERFTDLSEIVASMKPGNEVELTVWRDRKERTIEVGVEEMPEPTARVAGTAGNRVEPGSKLGLSVRPLTPEEKQRAGTDGAIVVEEVGSPAAQSGVRPGDVILGVNGKTIESVEQLREAVEKAPDPVALLIERGNAQLFVPVPTG